MAARESTAPNLAPNRVLPSGTTGEGDTANMKVNVQQHGFSGKTVEIKIYKGEKEDPKQQFFGLNHYQITITRDKWVRVPVEMADHIEGLVTTVKEPDPDFPDNEDKFVWADKQRFPLTRRDA
jgi:hypothetical protein